MDLSADGEFERFSDAAQRGNLVPLYERHMCDQLTAVLAYRCLVKEDDREAPSFLFESVVNGTQQVRDAVHDTRVGGDVLGTDEVVSNKKIDIPVGMGKEPGHGYADPAQVRGTP